MLRDYTYTLDSSLIINALKRFNLDIPEALGAMALLEFKLLTPDSFMWRFLINGTIYYLYAEDFVEGLENVRGEIGANIRHSPNLKFIEARMKKEFENTEPVASAEIYKKSDGSREMMKYAIDSGYDFVFLCRSDEDTRNALFNND